MYKYARKQHRVSVQMQLITYNHKKLITHGKILSVHNRLQAGDYENGNGGRVSQLTRFIHATLQLHSLYHQIHKMKHNTDVICYI